jgi:hypothetical protein
LKGAHFSWEFEKGSGGRRGQTTAYEPVGRKQLFFFHSGTIKERRNGTVDIEI